MRIVKLICTALSAWMICVGIMTTTASAQSVFDVNPPVIELDETREGISGETQVFTALVTDDLGLQDVKLYHRFAGQTPYNSLLMTQLGDTDYFTANVPTEETETRTIEYYIQARDNGGNRVIKGFAFEPYLRYLIPPEPLEAEEQEIVTAAPEPTPEPAPVKKSGGFKWWYLVLGIIAAGGIATAAGGGGDDGGSGGGGSPTQVPGTVTISNL